MGLLLIGHAATAWDQHENNSAPSQFKKLMSGFTGLWNINSLHFLDDYKYTFSVYTCRVNFESVKNTKFKVYFSVLFLFMLYLF